ncbi:MAG: alpha/beta fold hydrolase [Candidatus Levyibacteriota bacterium]
MKYNQKFIYLFACVLLFVILAIGVTVHSRFRAEVDIIKTQDAKIAYYSRGRGDPIVLLPGFGMTMEDWDPLFLEKLATNHKLIILDYRGVGASTGSVTDITEGQLAQDVITTLHQLKIQKASVLGWSLGSFVAQVVAEQSPGSIDKLILISTGPGDDHQIGASTSIANAIDSNLGGSWEKIYVPYLFVSKQAKNDYLNRRNNAVKSKEIPDVPGETLDAKIGYERAFADNNQEKMRYDKLSTLHVPTLIIAGNDDELLPPENDKRTATQIPGSQLLIISHAGHGVLFEKTDEVTSAINTFLGNK